MSSLATSPMMLSSVRSQSLLPHYTMQIPPISKSSFNYIHAPPDDHNLQANFQQASENLKTLIRKSPMFQDQPPHHQSSVTTFHQSTETITFSIPLFHPRVGFSFYQCQATYIISAPQLPWESEDDPVITHLIMETSKSPLANYLAQVQTDYRLCDMQVIHADGQHLP